MIEPKINTEDLEQWAAFLLEHSLGGVGAADRVMIKGERICWPLMEILERRVIEAGAIPDVYLIPPNNDRGKVWSATMGRHASAAQLEQIPPWHRERYEAMTKYVEILGAENPAGFATLDAEQVKVLAMADRPFSNLRLARPWVITLFPTPGYAELEGMDLEEYTRFIVKASTTDPRPLKEAEERLAPLMGATRRVTIETHHPGEDRPLKLTMSIEQGRARISYGIHNFPDGEIFTSPDARSAEGEIFVDLPVQYGGNEIRGIYLRLEGGEITSYRAEVGQEQLAAIIETDPGSRRLGEVALGMNPGLDKVLKHPLFVEKVGGTLHIAIGASYEDCFVKDPASDQGRKLIEELEAQGILNRSAQHVDIVTDFRPGGCGVSVHIDDTRMVPRDGVWVAEV